MGLCVCVQLCRCKISIDSEKVKAADYTVPLGAQELTFSVLSELWLSTLNDLEESSIAHYRYSIEHYILPVIGNLRISQLSGAKLELCVLQIISPVGGEHKPFWSKPFTGMHQPCPQAM